MTGAARRERGRVVAVDKTTEENSERSGMTEENIVGIRGGQDLARYDDDV